tara:strand:+ start:325 stop:1485 length:1161 start_codon:yes stop_codon:yes gene_type:complete
MSFFKFGDDDLFINTIEGCPEYRFYIQSSSVYIDDTPTISGSSSDNIIGVSKNFVSLYEYNIDRPTGNNIYPFVTKDGFRNTFKKLTRINYQALEQPGNTVTSSYNMSASIGRYYYSTAVAEPSRKYSRPLKNAFKHYSYLSPHYQYSSSLGDKASQNLNLITIPSILYGSSIKKGTVRLRYYFTGSLIGELQDLNENGELIQVGPVGSTGSGSVAGVVLYNEGFISLTGSWSLNPETIAYDASDTSKWIYFGYGANDTNTTPSLTSLSSSFLLEYSGTTHIQTMTMLAHAKYGELNHSNNPTFYSGSENFQISTGSYTYIETPPTIKNITYSQFADEIPTLKKTVYISKIGIYDKDKNLIGIAKVATPVRKTEDNDYTFKLKLDI